MPTPSSSDGMYPRILHTACTDHGFQRPARVPTCSYHCPFRDPCGKRQHLSSPGDRSLHSDTEKGCVFKLLFHEQSPPTFSQVKHMWDPTCESDESRIPAVSRRKGLRAGPSQPVPLPYAFPSCPRSPLSEGQHLERHGVMTPRKSVDALALRPERRLSAPLLGSALPSRVVSLLCKNRQPD